jgi:serine/threonine-protein kinase
MGSVWRAEHIELATQAAVKLIDEDFAQSPEALTRFRREAQAAASLRSVHVVQILDYGIDGDTPYIAMELLDGESLAARLTRSGRLPPAECATILLQVSKALARAHERGIVHRDLKPDNVFLVRDGDDEITKVLDFGIAKRTNGFQTSLDMATRTGSLMGTPYYMSPEQASGRRAVDHRTDIWAFGIIAFECLLGRRPYDDANLGGLLISICTENSRIPSSVGMVPPGFDDWFRRATAKDPDARFQSIRDAALELCHLCGVHVPASRWGSAANLEGSAGAPLEAGRAAAMPWQDPGARPSAATPAGIVRGDTGAAQAITNVNVGSSHSSLLMVLVAGIGAAVLFGGGFFAVQRLATGSGGVPASVSAALTTPVPSSAAVVTTDRPSVAAAPESPSAPLASAQPLLPSTPQGRPEGSRSESPLPARRVRQPANAPAPVPSPAVTPEPTAAPKPSPHPEDVPRLQPRDRLERDLGI